METRRAAFRVDGNRHIGLGHFFRALNWARYLGERGWRCEFFTLAHGLPPFLKTACAAAGFPLRDLASGNGLWREEEGAFARAVAEERFDAVIVDLLEPDPEDDDLTGNTEFQPVQLGPYLETLRETNATRVIISDRIDRLSFSAEIVTDAAPEQDPRWYADRTGNRHCVGPDFYLLPPSFRALRDSPRPASRERKRIVVFLGGHDHRGFTLPVLDGLNGLAAIEIIIGAGTGSGSPIERECSARGLAVHREVAEVAPLLASAALVVSTAGNTLFDLAALGVPALALSTRPRQRRTAEFFAAAGSCLDLGGFDDGLVGRVRESATALLDDENKLAEMSRSGRATIDGCGMDRLTAVLESELHSRRGSLRD